MSSRSLKSPVTMVPTPRARAATPLTTSSTTPPPPPSPPQRQSCDRCHKQKLRCTRENNSNGGGCDRCFRKRVQCVYSFSLPKGRPSPYRLTDESTTTSTNGTRSPEMAQEPLKPRATAPAPAVSADVDAVSKMNVDEIPVPSPSTSASQSMSTNEPATLASPMDISLDVSTDTWPRLEALSWDYTQVGMDWNSHDSAGSQYDTVLASLNAFWDDGDLREGMEPCSPTNLPYPPRPFHPHAYPHSQVGGSNLKGQDGSSRSNIDNCIEGGVDGRINRSTDMYMNWPSLVIAQLSQLSTYLSSLRYSSYTLAEAAESSSAHPPNGQATPLIHAAAFESVATWLAHGQGSANMNTQPSDNGPTKRQDPYPSSTPETKPKSSSGILHDVFSASHRLLEILSYLQVRTNVESYNSSTTTSPSTPSTVSSSQNSIYPGLAKGPWPSAPSSGSRQSCNNTMEIIRHLVMACETLLLEIYMAVFMALQHDAYHGACMNTMALGNVKLVLVVQLCSYLMERQHQAVDMCLAPQTAPSTVSSSKTFPDKLDFAGLQQPVSTGPVVGTAGREVLSDFRKQVQQRLAHLWQTVRCT